MGLAQGNQKIKSLTHLLEDDVKLFEHVDTDRILRCKKGELSGSAFISLLLSLSRRVLLTPLVASNTSHIKR